MAGIHEPCCLQIFPSSVLEDKTQSTNQPIKNELGPGADLGGRGGGGTWPPLFPKKYYTFMFSLRSPKVTSLLPRPPFSKILDPPLTGRFVRRVSFLAHEYNVTWMKIAPDPPTKIFWSHPWGWGNYCVLHVIVLST